MQTPLKTKLFFTLLLISLALAQGYMVHACQSIYQSLTEKNSNADLLMNDYLKYYP